MFILHDIDANRSHLLHTVDVFATKHLTYAEIIEEIIILESIYMKLSPVNTPPDSFIMHLYSK